MWAGGADDLANLHHIMHQLGQRSKNILDVSIYMLWLFSSCLQSLYLDLQAVKAQDRIHSSACLGDMTT